MVKCEIRESPCTRQCPFSARESARVQEMARSARRKRREISSHEFGAIGDHTTTSKAPVTTSDALVTTSFLLLLVRHLLLVRTQVGRFSWSHLGS